MSEIYSTGFAPDPGSARDVLAFVLCPAEAFAPGGDAGEMEAVREVMGPVKAEAIRRWQQAHSVASRS
ncbi:MAG TPA: hypothetical protein VFG83_12025 [Kofleriaceae bacterium]|nr:hypothetical protein [Kofleriaceae bacterium]